MALRCLAVGLGSGRDRPSAQGRYTQSGARLRKPATTQRRPDCGAALRMRTFQFRMLRGPLEPSASARGHVGTYARARAPRHQVTTAGALEL